MGVYVNSRKAGFLYKCILQSPYFVDKSMLLRELLPLIGSDNRYICITRPRRFGKTVMANMAAAFLGKNKCGDIFGKLKISGAEEYGKHLNRHNVVHIDFSKVHDECECYQEYISAIKEILREDLHEEFSDIRYRTNGSVSEDLLRITEKTGQKFVFILDEWDAVFHMDFVSKSDCRKYLLFLKNLLKDQPYVELAYMTGILPIAKYSSGSELNMFLEYTMTSKERYGNYFGFTENEVDMLYQRYAANTPEAKVTREGLREWYDGYQAMNGDRLYNPRSIVASLQDNQLADYWTSSGPYDEIFYYVKNNIADVRDDIALMISGESVSAKIQEYSAAAMEAILQQAHDTETGMVGYNNEAELSAVVKLVYLAAREYYDIQREDKAGTGYVDYIFYPVLDKSDDCMILELKVNHTAEDAIQQIKDKNYMQRFIGKLGEKSPYRGRILAVGIAYSKNGKGRRHECKVEILRGGIYEKP